MRGHDGFDGFVGGGSFVDDVLVFAALDAFGHANVIGDGEAALGFTTRHGASCAVGAAHERFGITFAADNVGASAHAPGDDAHVTKTGTDGTLPGDEDVAAVVFFAGDIVVVAVDGFEFGGERADFAGIADGGDDLAHHEIAIGAGKILSPFDGFDVIEEMLGAFGKVGKILVGEIGDVLLHVFAGEFDEVGAHAIANAARAGVKHEPDVVRLVEADFNEMIAGAESAEMIGVIAAIKLGMFFEDGVIARLEIEPGVFGVSGDDVPSAQIAASAVIGAAVGHGGFNGRANGMEIIGEIAGIEVGLHGHHAATNVDADGGGNDGALGRDDATDSGANAPMDVGHGGDPFVDEGKLGDVEELLASLILEGNTFGPRFDGRRVVGGDQVEGGVRHKDRIKKRVAGW